MSVVRSFFVATIFGACAGQHAAPPPPPTDRAAPPVTVTVEVMTGVPVVGSRMTLRGRIDRHAEWRAPIAAHFELPRGAVLRGGVTEAMVASGTGDLEIEIELDTLPKDDLVFSADSRTSSSGFHAVATYRFGRPEPLQPDPPKTGPSSNLNGVDLGPSVSMPAPGGSNRSPRP